MNRNIIAHAELVRARDDWLENTVPKLREAKVFETLAEEAAKALGYGKLEAKVVREATGSFNLCHFVEFETPDAAVLQSMPAGGRWIVRLPYPKMPHIMEKYEAEIATLQ